MNKLKNKTAVIWLMGGLGNCFFQMFYGFLLSKKEGYDIFYSYTLTKGHPVLSLLGWSIHENSFKNFISESSLKEFNIIHVIIPFIAKKLKLHGISGYFFNDDNFIKLVIPLHIFGYFQNKNEIKKYEYYFHEYCAYIRKFLENKYRFECVVHFRLGDSTLAYKHSKYYHAVLLKCASFDKVVVVTDSPIEANSFFNSLENCEIIISNSVLNDFSLMANADNLFCAPSTLSWWAAHVNNGIGNIYFPTYLFDQLGIMFDSQRIILIND
jgi:hypothetical protein